MSSSYDGQQKPKALDERTAGILRRVMGNKAPETGPRGGKLIRAHDGSLYEEIGGTRRSLNWKPKNAKERKAVKKALKLARESDREEDKQIREVYQEIAEIARAEE